MSEAPTTSVSTDGAPPAGSADVQAQSSRATTTPRTERQRMGDSLREGRKANASPRNDAEANPVPANPRGAQRDETGRFAGQAEQKAKPDGAPTVDEAKADKGEPDAVPRKVFLERIARAEEGKNALKEQLHAERLQLAKAQEAVKLMHAEMQRYERAAQSGERLDPRDTQLRQYELERAARESLERIQQTHSQQIQQETEGAQLSSLKESLQSDIGAALQKHPLLHDLELKSELQRVWQQNPNATIEQVAAALHERKLSQYAQLRPATPPAAPTTARSTPSGSGHKLSNDAKGIKAYLSSLNQRA